jgi:hypothetical protein
VKDSNPTSQTTGLPSGDHSPEDGRAALVFVRTAIADLRPDIAAIVLTTALSELAMRIPSARRSQYIAAVETMMTTQLLRARTAA